MFKKRMSVNSSLVIGLCFILHYGMPVHAQPPPDNPWAYSPQQQRNVGPRPWGHTPSSARRDTRSERRNQGSQQSDQPCQSDKRTGAYSTPGYYGFSDPYLGMPHGLPGGGWMNPLYPVDPYMGWH